MSKKVEFHLFKYKSQFYLGDDSWENYPESWEKFSFEEELLARKVKFENYFHNLNNVIEDKEKINNGKIF